MGRRTVWAQSPYFLLLEQLAGLEFGAFLAAAPLLSLGGEGQGRPVLVLPPFGASDWSTAPLRAVLRQRGSATYGWRLGGNVGPHPQIVAGIERRLLEVSRRHQTTVTVIGWSLGGIFARKLARSHRGAVRQVITLGSPYRFGSGVSRAPLPVPATSIYTRTDGIVNWKACIEAVGPTSENIEVRGSHSGLGFNVAAVIAICDRLAQEAGSWAPFRSPAALGCLFPTPASYAKLR